MTDESTAGRVRGWSKSRFRAQTPVHLALPPARCTRVLTLHRPSPGSRGFPGQAHDTRSSDSADIYCMSRGRSSDSIQVQRCVCVLDCFWPTYNTYIHVSLTRPSTLTALTPSLTHRTGPAYSKEARNERQTFRRGWRVTAEHLETATRTRRAGCGISVLDPGPCKDTQTHKRCRGARCEG